MYVFHSSTIEEQLAQMVEFKLINQLIINQSGEVQIIYNFLRLVGLCLICRNNLGIIGRKRIRNYAGIIRENYNYVTL